jgi:hypothetical protein
VLYLARHECGTKICREKGIECARRLLGHTNISTTQRYLHLDERELADAQVKTLSRVPHAGVQSPPMSDESPDGRHRLAEIRWQPAKPPTSKIEAWIAGWDDDADSLWRTGSHGDEREHERDREADAPEEIDTWSAWPQQPDRRRPCHQAAKRGFHRIPSFEEFSTERAQEGWRKSTGNVTLWPSGATRIRRD